MGAFTTLSNFYLSISFIAFITSIYAIKKTIKDEKPFYENDLWPPVAFLCFVMAIYFSYKLYDNLFVFDSSPEAKNEVASLQEAYININTFNEYNHRNPTISEMFFNNMLSTKIIDDKKVFVSKFDYETRIDITSGENAVSFEYSLKNIKGLEREAYLYCINLPVYISTNIKNSEVMIDGEIITSEKLNIEYMKKFCSAQQDHSYSIIFTKK